jgi:hypothetical protein
LHRDLDPGRHLQSESVSAAASDRHGPDPAW